MDIATQLDSVYAEIQASEKTHKKLLAKRDKLARKAVDSNMTWREVQTRLHLSPRGLSMVLERTK